jgi:putative NADH-flavin reductase
MTILVTGGTGLVGSRLLRRFVDAVDCRALVRPGKEVPSRARPVEGDLLEADSLKQAVEGVSAIVHLAAVFRTQNEDDIWRANLDGTKNLIAAAKAHAPQGRFVMASTGLVYDADASHPGLEDDATNPKLAYPASKIAAENELRNSGLNWSILRLPFVYGDGDGHLAAVPGDGHEVQVAPGEDVQPRSPARRCTRGRTCPDWGNGWAHRQHCRRRAYYRLRDRQPRWLPHRAVSGALDQSVDGPHGWITESCSRLPPDGCDCVSSYATRNSVTSARDRGP